MCHRVSQWSLQELLVGEGGDEGGILKVRTQCLERVVEPRNLLREGRQPRRCELSAAQKGPRVADDACHVPKEFVWRTNVRPSAELAKRFRRATQRFLRAIREWRYICQCFASRAPK